MVLCKWPSLKATCILAIYEGDAFKIRFESFSNPFFYSLRSGCVGILYLN